MNKEEILIIGAGPTGLAAALFLADKGYKARIIERKEKASTFSKAFGVNARSLSLLKNSGVTGKFLENGREFPGLKLHKDEKILAEFTFANVDHEYPYLCVQSQADSERILSEALAERGVIVERGIEVTSVQNTTDGAKAVCKRFDGGEFDIHAKTIWGADGASSKVRESLGLTFDGRSYPETWYLWDIELEIDIDPDCGHIFLLPKGGMFVVRHKDNLWRVLGHGENLLQSLPKNTSLGKVHWESSFKISNLVASQFSVGNIYIGGDAAHTHAGIGARGMNLGIEDAHVFAEQYSSRTLDRYNKVRRPVVEKVVKQITHLMNVPRSSTVPGKFVRTFPFIVPIAAPLARKYVEPWVLGLDHEVKL